MVSYVEMLHSPQLVLFLVLSYLEMLHSPTACFVSGVVKRGDVA